MDDYYTSERLDPEDARNFITELVHCMRKRAWYKRRNDSDSDIEMGEDKPSEGKQLYGQKWTLLYGISKGMTLMDREHEKEYDCDNAEQIDHGISGDDSWQEHYDEYGYGAYGRGLKIGKRLAFYEDRDFDFSSNESQTDSTESSESETNFTISSYE